MMPDNRSSTPALDFLAFLQGRADTPGYEDMLDERERGRVSQILADMDERRARGQLIRMQGQMTSRAYLDPADIARLTSITGPPKTYRIKLPLHPPTRIAAAATGVLIVIGATAGIRAWVDSGSGGAPPPATAPQVPPAAQAPLPAYNDLSLFKRDWGPFQQLTPSDASPQTGAPALLLLQSGGYYVTRWVVNPLDSGWQQDITGDVATVNVHGDYIDFTDSNGSPWIVRADQPFVFSSDPAVVLRIDATGTVYEMTQAHATVARKPLK